ncbi:TfuA domain-containing protein [Streptomyces misionensis]|uniref:TfuA domain-containing protein n=1 Tax=Streptomyces misionensis TaxID=67331 RepID=UPI0033AD2635
MIHVFVGPTLPRSHPMLSAPGVRPAPPIGHGDLFDPAIGSSDTVLIIDGVYHQAPALRHKEILAAMGRGVRVIGAASIGALRAAELAPFGMLGVGSIYAAYARGEIEGDDEVAVGQAPDGQWNALTWPVVNLRHTLNLACAAGLLDTGRAEQLLAALRAVYYPQRTTAAVRAVCHQHNERQFAGWLTEQLDRDPHFGDLKRTDALAAVSAAVNGVPPATTRPSPHTWESTHFRRWSNASARAQVDGLDLLTEDRLIYQQVFNPAFRERWTTYLEHRSLHPADGSPGLPLKTRSAQVGTLPAHRLFHPVVDLRDKAAVGLLLAGETPEHRRDVTRHAAALAAARRDRPGFSIAAIRADLARRMLLRAWRCPDHLLDEEASARGLVCEAHATETAKRMVPGYLATERVEAASAAR